LCSPLFPNHLELAVNDQFAPAAAFLDTATVNHDPPHVTFVVDPARDSRTYGVVSNHAYWLYDLTVRQSGSEGRIDVDCNVRLNITTDGPIAVSLPACNRVVNAG
jgi:hypothetical protein